MEISEKIKAAARIIRENPSKGMAFTGAGISVESGIPPFRGSDGLWSQVDLFKNICGICEIRVTL